MSAPFKAHKYSPAAVFGWCLCLLLLGGGAFFLFSRFADSRPAPASAPRMNGTARQSAAPAADKNSTRPLPLAENGTAPETSSAQNGTRAENAERPASSAESDSAAGPQAANGTPRTQASEAPGLPAFSGNGTVSAGEDTALSERSLPTVNGTAPETGILPAATNGTRPEAPARHAAGNETLPGVNEAVPLQAAPTAALNGTGKIPPAHAGNGTAASPVPAELDPTWKPLLDRLEADGLDRKDLEAVFARLGKDSYTPAYMAAKIGELYGVFGIGLPRNQEDPPVIPAGYAQPLECVTLGECRAFRAKYDAQFKDIQQKYGVPPQIVMGVMLVETGIGSDLGAHSALQVLAGMALTNTPQMLAAKGNGAQVKRMNPKTLQAGLSNKSEWAYKETLALLRYAAENKLDAATLPASMFGAIGICQFMPSNISLFGADGDGDGRIDLFAPVDAMYSIASYLAGNGWQSAKTETAQFNVILTYNYDGGYASMVQGTANLLARAFKGKGSDASCPVVGGYYASARSLDPSLRRLKRPPASTAVKLDGYGTLME